MNKPVLGITMFELILFRSYFSKNSDSILKNLFQDFDIVFFTNTDIAPLIKIKMAFYPDESYRIIVYNQERENVYERFISFFLRWSLKSGTILVKSKQKSFFWQTLIFIPYHIIANFSCMKFILRYALRYSIFDSVMVRRFNPEPVKLNFLLVTSLTNNYEDARVAIYYQRKNVKVIGTVRSWDNLTSHGSLYLEPDLFLAQSKWLHECALKLHFIPEYKILDINNPAYEKSFKAKLLNLRHNDRNNRVNITFASMGISVNPDDFNFTMWLTSIWDRMPDNYYLTVLSHPKFQMKLEINSPKIQHQCFDFSTSNLEEYYDFLRSQNIVLCGGTSVLLDCAFVGTPVIIVHFDTVEQNYWKSALRYFDFMDHTKSLIETFEYTYARDALDVISKLKSDIFRIEANNNAQTFLGMSGPSIEQVKFLSILLP